MAAEIDGTGIVFSDSTRLDSKYDIFAQGTTSIFYQASAPTGWSKSNSNDNKALRVVTGTGGPGQGGGSINFTTFTGRSFTFPYSSNSPTNNKTLSSNQIPSHTHSTMGTKLTANPQNPNGSFNGGDVAKAPGWSQSTDSTGGVSGPSQHSHPFSSSGTSPSISCNINVQYIDVIQCNFDIDA